MHKIGNVQNDFVPGLCKEKACDSSVILMKKLLLRLVLKEFNYILSRSSTYITTKTRLPKYAFYLPLFLIECSGMKTMVYFWNVFVAHQPKKPDMIILGKLLSKTLFLHC